jgi:hypothetical protein
MVRFTRPADLEPVWKEMKRLWRQDAIRRRHLVAIEDLRRAYHLGAVQIWLAWDDAPPDRGEFGGPHYCLGIVVTCLWPRHALCVQFAAGRALQKWVALAGSALEAFARSNHCVQLEIHCRKGWLQELRSLWTFPGEVVTFHRDPELLHVHSGVAATVA